MTYSKDQLLIDIDTMHVAFRAILYASRVAFDTGLVNIGNIDVQTLSKGQSEIISGLEFAHLIPDQTDRSKLLSVCATFSRANLLIATYERVKGYCHATKSTHPVNERKFIGKEPHRFADTLIAFRVLRHAATHWNPAGTLYWKPSFPSRIEVHGIVLHKDIKERELNVNNTSVQKLIYDVTVFVREELI